MSKPVLLACPHTFIVAEMKPFFNKDDLANPGRRAIAVRLFQRHFRSL